jgi:hypothetical protein
MTRNPDLVRKEFLHERGRRVVVVDSEPQFGRGLSPARRNVMLAQMPLEGIELCEGASDIRIGAKEVSFRSEAGETIEVPADTVNRCRRCRIEHKPLRRGEGGRLRNAYGRRLPQGGLHHGRRAQCRRCGSDNLNHQGRGIGRPEEIAAVAAFLCSPAASLTACTDILGRRAGRRHGILTRRGDKVLLTSGP